MHKVAVIGASGYTGVELLRLLAGHPQVTVTCVTSRQQAGQSLGEVFPSLAGVYDLNFEAVEPAAVAGRAELVFTAVPHQAAMGMVPALLAAGCKVIDLSADYRLHDAAVYAEWYEPHQTPDLLAEAVYGLPELYREQVRGARLVANPGCYPTSAALALAPLLRARLIDAATIIIDSKSGTSGAGRAAKVDTLYCEVNEGFKAYGLPRHRHTPEIEQTLSEVAGVPVTISFTPHLVPVNRGILSTCYASLAADVSLTAVLALYRETYAGESFVRVLPEGHLPNINQVRGSNFCDIGLAVDPRTRRVIAVAAIDNLVKGAAGQALQNMNLLFGFPETAGLARPGRYP